MCCHAQRPGSFRGGAIERKQCYFSPREWENQSPLEPEPFYQEVRQIFERNLPRYFNGPERIGLSLTGGLDTRTILAWLSLRRGRFLVIHLAAAIANAATFALPARWRRPAVSPRSDSGWDGVSLSLSPLRGARGVSDRRLRRREPFPGSLRERTGAPDCSRPHDRQLWRPDTPSHVCVPAQRAHYGLFNSDFLAHVPLREKPMPDRSGHALTLAAFRQAPWHYHGLLVWSRRSSPCGLRMWITNLSGLSFALLHRHSRTTTCVCVSLGWQPRSA